ncbi:MAG: hypothetical protein AB8C95_01650 [Phycisphaeraceae bacterium]
MNRSRWIYGVIYCLTALCLITSSTLAQAEAAPIAQSEITSLQTQLDAAKQASSSARKKLAFRRLIRASDALLEKQADAPNRFEVLSILFQTQQQQIKIDDSATNRRAFLKTAEQLAKAPKQYAALRLDADLLVSQTALAQRGSDLQARADALKSLVDRYQDTEVEAKIIRVALVMAIELGDAGLIQHLRETIAQRMPGDLEMINFQRDKLAGQVFGAPFVGQFKRSDGTMARFPMDAMGKTTALYFWSKEGDGIEQLKLLAEGWKAVPAESNAAIRYQFVSFNLDGLPDAGESILREAGLDWPAMHLPDGRESQVYKTYVRADPKLLTLTPTGYAAMVMSGATRVRPDRGWDRNFQSGLARSWAKPSYTSQVQSILAGEFLIVDPAGAFDPALPPELKAVINANGTTPGKLSRTDTSVPEVKLQAIQDCFVKQPTRNQLSYKELKANYEQAVSLTEQAIEEHTQASDLWIVRNRRIIALQGLWKLTGKRSYFDSAAEEANTAMQIGYPVGTDVVARLCLARQAIQNTDGDAENLISEFVLANGSEPIAATVYAVASLLALEIGERKLHEQYRRLSLDNHADHPMLWGATSFLLNRYHRYWLYHPPFTAGWTYGRRMGHFLAIGTPEDAERSLEVELKTLEGQTVHIPDNAAGKWNIILFSSDVSATSYASRYGAFIKDRPFEDINLTVAVLDDDVNAVQEALKARKKQDDVSILLVPNGVNNSIVQHLGFLDEESRPNIAIVQPDGEIAAVISALTMRHIKGNVMQDVMEWQDEKAVDDALSRGDLKEAKRLAFAFAPLEEPTPEGQKPKAKKKISVPHLRSRAKVYAAMGEWESALKDAQAVYLEVNKKAGWLSMRTKDLQRTERLRDRIQAELNKPTAAK